jgi:aspartyl-tRNA(Asn)/glutamyl-tRNA(Gln) amidotransferase subunit A
LRRAFDLAGALFTADAWGWWGERIEAAPEKMFFQIYQRVRAGADVSASQYLRAWRELRQIRSDYAAATAGYDAVILPTSPIAPPNVDRLVADEAYFRSENLLALRNTRVANLMGLCAMTLPTGTPSAGIMFNAAPGGEARLLRLCGAAAAALA